MNKRQVVKENTTRSQHNSRLCSRKMFYIIKDATFPKFLSHTCSPRCCDYFKYNSSILKGYNPLSKPLLCGWARLIIKARDYKGIVYKAPCGRTMRNITEVHQYLQLIKNSDMTVDLFDFNPRVECLVEFKVLAELDVVDLSDGMEQVPIPVMNSINNEVLDFCNYTTKRVPTEDVHINLDPDFLCSCDCYDDCNDKTKCTCWKLTLEGGKYMGKNIDLNTVGYTYRRLIEPVITGIYECNSKCKCKTTCLNRVVQNPMSLNLQVFKTYQCGWGIRCLNDVPQGTFICVYAGTLHTEQVANKNGVEYGDEYFAQLDYIEVVEKHKEGYEAEAIEEDKKARNKRKRKKLDTTEPQSNSITSDNDSIIIISDDEDQANRSSVRKQFGANESVYVMDAKNVGNIGRFFNHSCSPNVFVQNVFVDTQDPRFPWVAFFTAQYIEAGTELTWDYSYQIGSVPGRVLYCQCSSFNCKGRLL